MTHQYYVADEEQNLVSARGMSAIGKCIENLSAWKIYWMAIVESQNLQVFVGGEAPGSPKSERPTAVLPPKRALA